MDLVANPEGTKIIVLMDHVAKGDKHKILDRPLSLHPIKGRLTCRKTECDLPLTGVNCVSTIITDLCVFQVDREAKKLTLTELAPGVTEEEVRKKTGAKYDVSPDLREMQ